jgi:hypothetical protein
MTVVAVLVVLVVITLASSALLRAGLAQREFARGAERRLQSEWLVESGMERARARLDLDRDYTGETWSLSAGDLGLPPAESPVREAGSTDRAAAVVTIAVARVQGSALERQVRVEAEYPRGAQRPARQSKQMLIDLEPTKGGTVP